MVVGHPSDKGKGLVMTTPSTTPLGDGMRTAIAHDWATLPGGAEDVLREVCEMAPHARVHLAQWDPGRVHFLKERDVWTSFINRLPYGYTKHHLYAPILTDVYRRIDLTRYDLVLCDSHSFAHGVKVRPSATFVCYYHTPFRSIWTPEIDPRASQGRAKWLRERVMRRIKRYDLAASARPTVLMANSQTTADRIRKFYGREVEAVVYPPVQTATWLDVRRESDDAGLLFWGRLVPHKRVDLAIEAARVTGERLNIVGKGPAEAALKEQAKGMANVVFHGRLPDDELKALMARCRAVLFPCYEDFGIVPVEAMAAGLPVVAYGVGGAGESVLPEFGVLFHEQTPQALVDAIVESRRKAFDPDRARVHAQTFDASHFRRRYREIVERALNGPPNRL